ncbi:MAG: hypothetical protein WBD22_04760 [Pyrinomonadaceae bacterium]
MFCAKCGKPDQSPETYCRKCGTFLPDFEKVRKSETPAEQHIKANSYLALMTAVVSLSLAITLYATLGFRPETHWIIYVVAGFLIAMTAWQIQTYIRTRMLKKQFEKMTPKGIEDVPAQNSTERAQLDEANFEDIIPASVTERTTRNLTQKSPQSKQ